MAGQRQLKVPKARRSTPVVRRRRVTIREKIERLGAYSDPSRMTPAQIEHRNRALYAALGRPGGTRADLESYTAAAVKYSKASARRRAKPKRATTMKPRKKAAGKAKGAWVYVKAHKRRRPR